MQGTKWNIQFLIFFSFFPVYDPAEASIAMGKSKEKKKIYLGKKKLQPNDDVIWPRIFSICFSIASQIDDGQDIQRERRAILVVIGGKETDQREKEDTDGRVPIAYGSRA
jgi:hypothetical protein